MKNPNPKVDIYLERAEQWPEEMAALRAILLGVGLEEEFKWGKPCYAYEGSNVAIVQPFKETCTLMFCKGVLLKDAKGLLEEQGEHSQSARVMRFKSVRDVEARESVLKAYLKEAIAAEKAGLKVEFKKNPEPVPAELQQKLNASPAFKKAFEALTPGRQRGYILFIIGAKQSATRAARVEKYRTRIMEGRGINDR